MFYLVRINYSKKEKWSSIIIGNLNMPKISEMLSFVEPIITKLHLMALLAPKHCILRIHYAATKKKKYKITKFNEVDSHILVYIGSTMFGFRFMSNLITQGSQI